MQEQVEKVSVKSEPSDGDAPGSYRAPSPSGKHNRKLAEENDRGLRRCLGVWRVRIRVRNVTPAS